MVESQAWDELSRYRQRYDIEDRVGSIASLERSIQRRRSRASVVRRRVGELEGLLAESQRELTVIESEITQSRRVGAQLIREILDQVRIDHHEAWTPTPIRGFRMWQVNDDGFRGAKMAWLSPIFVAECLREVPGEDVPHPVERCGPPACGVYATKRIEMFPQGIGGRLQEGQAIGVVGMTGKVIEHAKGYRSARAIVLAVVVRYRAHWLLTAESELIKQVFADPATVVLSCGKLGFPPAATIDAFLNETRQKEETWTSESN